METNQLMHPWFPVLILALPLLASVVQLFAGRRLPRGGDWVSTLMILAGFVLSLITFADVVLRGDPGFRYERAFNWISFGSVNVTMGILVDNLTAVMLVLVTGISSCVHVFSMFYMHGDRRYPLYFSYLSFFCFSMIGIVISDNLLMTFMFWELVGYSSYALIGFWFEREAAAEAQKKAFVVNRVGDVGFLIGLMIIFYVVGDFRFGRIFEAAANGTFDRSIPIFGLPLVTLAGIGIFLGAMGKSAQFPFHVWLPDAMEGPTTASSLIHAATMVAAGVFLTARIYPILTPEALIFITYVGTFTAFMAATIALVQSDIKRVLAYSTISQLGYMMLGLGSGGYTAGLAHLFTHAFFKCLLFLCAGSVIHALHTQDMFRMGGLRKKMPVTFAAMLMGTLAISGVPLFSGFFSKDAILVQALYRYFTEPHLLRLLPFVFGMGSAALTAFYMFRLIFLTFFGKPRDKKIYAHAHESPLLATAPLCILAVFTLGFFWTGTVDIPVPSGEVKIPVGIVKQGWVQEMIVEPAIAAGHYENQSLMEDEPAHKKAEHLVEGLSLLSASFGILLAWLIYIRKAVSAQAIRRRFRLTVLFLENLWYVDRLYEIVIVRGLHRWNALVFQFDQVIIDGLVNAMGCSGEWLSRGIGCFDRVVIDGAVNLTATVSQSVGREFSRLQNGKIQGYVFLGILSLCLYILIGVM